LQSRAISALTACSPFSNQGNISIPSSKLGRFCFGITFCAGGIVTGSFHATSSGVGDS
jgi:hypothetical protein